MTVQLPVPRPDDFAPVEAFAYAWRWTHAKYALFSVEDLGNVLPLRPAVASRVAKALQALVAIDGLAADRFERVERVERTDASGGWMVQYGHHEEPWFGEERT